jgi:hypothetical protein
MWGGPAISKKTAVKTSVGANTSYALVFVKVTIRFVAEASKTA